MAEGTAFSVVGKLAEYAVGPVWHQIKYLFFYNSNIQNLRDKVKDLENRRNDVKLQVDAAKRNAEIIGKEVLEWLRKVDELEVKANEVLKGVESSEMGCLFNGCSNLKSRYLLSRRATEKTIEANKLVEVKFGMLSSRPPPEQVLNLTSHEGFETRLSIKKKIKKALQDKDIGIIGIWGMFGVFSGMKKLEDLDLECYLPIEGEDAKVLKNAVSKLDGNGFINLKTLILEDGDFEYLIDATNTIPNGSFGKLESLQLLNLSKLREICNGNLPRVVFEPPLFCNLMKIYVFSCRAITSLFRESVAKCLVKLQSIEIHWCSMLEEVVSTDTRENEVTKACEMLEFPNLKEVRLSELSGFKSFTSQSTTFFNQVNFPNMEKLNVWKLPCIVKLLGKEMPITSLHKLTTILVEDCVHLQSIAESNSIQLLQNLDDLNVNKCNALEVLFDFEGIKVTNDDAEISVLGRLTTLWLHKLPELVHITRMVPKEICVFQNLIELRVEDCKRLRYLFLPTMANSLVALENLYVLKCESIKAIFGIEDEEEEEGTSEIKKVEAIKTRIVFPKLDSLLLEDLSSIQMFCSQNYELVFPLSMDLTIANCPMMEKIESMASKCTKA